MRYLTYNHNGNESYGVAINDAVYPMREIITDAPDSLIGFIESGQRLPDIDAIKKTRAQAVPLADVKIMAPIPYPRREIICLGKNYEDHIKEIKTPSATGQAIPAAPVYFGKRACPAIGPDDCIPAHEHVTSQLDYETELAVVIGKICENVEEGEALDYIFGYTLMNDVTARDVQSAHGQWYLGKSLAGFCPMGPVIVSADAMPDIDDINICSRVNGETRQKSNTGVMIFKIPFVISQLSRGFVLLPGDIIATGTPAGVGHGFDPPRHLKKGDVVECEADCIGVLRNAVR